MVLRFFLLAMTFLFISCSELKRDNPEDQQSENYVPPSSSSLFEPRSSSDGEIPSDSTASSSSGNNSVPSSGSQKQSSSGTQSALSSSSNAQTYSLSCNVPKKDFTAGIEIPIYERPKLICKETTTGRIDSLSDGNATIEWKNAPNWKNPAAGNYPSISAAITDATVCKGLNASCGTITVTAAPSSSSRQSSSSLALSSSSLAPSSSSLATSSGSFKDDRGGTYKWVNIKGQIWMAENLNYDTKNTGSKCYDNKETNCTTYGRLYHWDAATKACPSGWHLPSEAEWKTLVNNTGGDPKASRNLKAKSGWDSYSGNGDDTYGFTALPGGSATDNDFNFASTSGQWWSATESSGKIFNFALSENATEGTIISNTWNYLPKSDQWGTYFLSVRCVQN